jgi:hypothetical protein
MPRSISLIQATIAIKAPIAPISNSQRRAFMDHSTMN